LKKQVKIYGTNRTKIDQAPLGKVMRVRQKHGLSDKWYDILAWCEIKERAGPPGPERSPYYGVEKKVLLGLLKNLMRIRSVERYHQLYGIDSQLLNSIRSLYRKSKKSWGGIVEEAQQLEEENWEEFQKNVVIPKLGKGGVIAIIRGLEKKHLSLIKKSRGLPSEEEFLGKLEGLGEAIKSESVFDNHETVKKGLEALSMLINKENFEKGAGKRILKFSEVHRKAIEEYSKLVKLMVETGLEKEFRRKLSGLLDKIKSLNPEEGEHHTEIGKLPKSIALIKSRMEDARKEKTETKELATSSHLDAVKYLSGFVSGPEHPLKDKAEKMLAEIEMLDPENPKNHKKILGFALRLSDFKRRLLESVEVVKRRKKEKVLRIKPEIDVHKKIAELLEAGAESAGEIGEKLKIPDKEVIEHLKKMAENKRWKHRYEDLIWPIVWDFGEGE
jgi:hypothetical protein